MSINNREIVELAGHGGEGDLAPLMRRALETPGPTTLELDDWFIDLDETHTTVSIELDGVPSLRAKMPVEEFLEYADEATK